METDSSTRSLALQSLLDHRSALEDELRQTKAKINRIRTVMRVEARVDHQARASFSASGRNRLATVSAKVEARCKTVLAAYESGRTIASIAAEVGLSEHRVHQLLHRALWLKAAT